MKAMVFHEHGGVEKLHYQDFPDPELQPGDCLVRVKAVALNGFEPMILQKTTALPTPLPMIPGGDIAGEIVELGSAANDGQWRVGDRVSIYPMVPDEGMTGETRLGGCCELVRIPAGNLLPVPDDLDFVRAASLPIAYGTALRMMVSRGRVAAGETVLILGATGGVGTACVQLAKLLGAEVIACGSADWKLEKLRELGADHVVDTSREDFRKAVWERYGKPHMRHKTGGVDVVINYIGGDTWVDGCRALKPGGRMLTCGASAGFQTANDLRYIWTYELNLMGSNGWRPEDQLEMMAMVADGRIEPALHAVRPLTETPISIQELIERQVFGKTVLLP
ncbi:MAG: zinc-binding dehydrogenase [Alphaproteobacteria bacterium]|jgi:alcohol dehydrogenase|nr:zinc-binding dehydrogenase [Alphaproteobacteria bacterium]MDP6564359.1 zinc-binding dehydrogenase [Alphaproteobacteria bacterium]MDP6812529.1 zinc-binding dehydrogenase [Alphaproteobacteria bacterium]